MSAAAKLQKPVMRGMLHAQIRKHLTIAIAITIGVGVAERVFLANKRKEVYAEFYKNYDIDKEFDEIRNRGVFQSAASD